MANNYTKILELANKNNMGLSNTIKRDYGIPLDYSSVQETYDAALAYAKTSTLAYIGQPISVGDTLYIVTDEAGGYLKAVGTKPAGDEQSITIDKDGKIAIKGFEAAGDLTLPRKKVDGTLEWVPINSIVENDSNTKTIVQVAEDSALTITSKADAYDVDTDTYTYTLDVTLPAIPEYSVTKEVGEGQTSYKLTKDGAATGEVIIVPDAYDDTALAGRLDTIEGKVAQAEADITDHEGRLASVELFFKDASKDEGEGENLKNALDTLKEIQDYITTDGNTGAQIATDVQANKTAIETLNGDGEGSVKKAIDDAIATQAISDAAKYATQDALAAVSAVADAAAKASDVETALADKADKADLDSFYTTEETYTKDEIDALLDGITADTGATASQVDAKLTQHKAENEQSFKAVNDKNDEQDTAIQANTDAIAAINNETTGILAKAKTAAAADAQAKVDALANGTVATNTGNITSINAKIEGISGNITTINETLGTLQGKDTELDAAVKAEKAARETLETTVGEHTTAITALQSKDTELASLISANTAKFADYSTTTQVNKAIDDKIAAIDNTALTEAIAANTKAIGDEVTRADTEEKRLAGLINTNASNISALETAINAVIDDEDGTTLNSIKDLAAWVSEHETEVLPAIEANTNAITTLNGEADVDGSVKKTVADAIAGIPMATALKAGLVKASDEVTVSSDGVLGIGAVSTDKLRQGSLPLVLNGGTATN